MTNRELLERAARAAGVLGEYRTADRRGIVRPDGSVWNPLRGNDDAERLRRQLGIEITHYDASVQAGGVILPILPTDNRRSVTRRAIVRAAAASSASACKCTFHQYMVGDGCDVCNPELARELSE